MFFCDVERPKVRESQPDLSMTEISKVLGKMWAAMDDAAKDTFNKQAGEDRVRYTREMEDYKKTASSDDTPSEKKKK